jgi:4-amino-4-deoxy-L-arabinose transferase-like glycosyltransferase
VTEAEAPAKPDFAWRWLVVLAGALVTLLLAFAARYGYHRDELYFIAIGGHPTFGYADQPPLVPLAAHAMDAVSGHSLFWLRVLPALAAGAVVVVTGLIAREFGGGRLEQLLAAGAMAASGVLIGASHLMGTTPFDVLCWTILLLLTVRAMRDDGRVWLGAGLVAGIALEIKTLPAFLLFALVVGVLVCGPREVFRSRWLWAGAGIAVALWLPNLIWQARHGWPQLHLANSIAAGNSGSSEPRWRLIPDQFLIMGPPLAPVWIAGLWRLVRSPALRRWRFLAVAYGVLVVVFLATGGKPYYLAGTYPVLFAAGAGPTIGWLRRGARRGRLLVTVAAISAAISIVVALPVVPAADLHDTPVPAMNYDAGEQLGWPRFAATVDQAYHSLPPSERTSTVVLTGNYGEAGAVLRYAPDIPRVYSGHNAFWDYGPPPVNTTTVLAIGYPTSDLHKWFGSVRPMGRIDNGLNLENDEQGRHVWLCMTPRASWTTLWPHMRNLG